MLQIDPERFYREDELVAQHGFRFNELARGRKAGTLAFRELGRGRRVYYGRALLAWLRGDVEGEQAPAPAPRTLRPASGQ